MRGKKPGMTRRKSLVARGCASDTFLIGQTWVTRSSRTDSGNINDCNKNGLFTRHRLPMQGQAAPTRLAWRISFQQPEDPVGSAELEGAEWCLQFSTS